MISKPLSFEEFILTKRADKHRLIKLSVYDDDTLCSCIIADFSDKTFVFDNYINNAIKLPFGNNKTPDWGNFEEFLSEYNTLDIIKKTKGRMAEDNQWIDMEEI